MQLGKYYQNCISINLALHSKFKHIYVIKVIINDLNITISQTKV